MCDLQVTWYTIRLRKNKSITFINLNGILFLTINYIGLSRKKFIVFIILNGFLIQQTDIKKDDKGYSL